MLIYTAPDNDGTLLVKTFDFTLDREDATEETLLVLPKERDGISGALLSPKGDKLAFVDVNQSDYPRRTKLYVINLEEVETKAATFDLPINYMCGSSCYVHAGEDFLFTDNNTIQYAVYNMGEDKKELISFTLPPVDFAMKAANKLETDAQKPTDRINFMPVSLSGKSQSEFLVFGGDGLLFKIGRNNPENTWKVGWHINKKFIEILVKDVNQDGIQELWTHTSATQAGVIYQKYQLLSEKNDLLIPLYAYEGSMGIFQGISGGKHNDTLSADCTITFEDINKDGVLEIRESIDYQLYNGGNSYETIRQKAKKVKGDHIYFFKYGKYRKHVR